MGYRSVKYAFTDIYGDIMKMLEYVLTYSHLHLNYFISTEVTNVLVIICRKMKGINLILRTSYLQTQNGPGSHPKTRYSLPKTNNYANFRVTKDAKSSKLTVRFFFPFAFVNYANHF